MRPRRRTREASRRRLPGVVVSIAVKEGETVAAGQTLLVIEAMKMEHAIKAPRAGVVKALKHALAIACAKAARSPSSNSATRNASRTSDNVLNIDRQLCATKDCPHRCGQTL